MNYFITRIVCDGKAAKDHKSISNKAFPLFSDGHVQDIVGCIDEKYVFIRAKCLPEMKKTTTYKLELWLCRTSGDIVSCCCGCAAGGGPHGSCKHLAALCYALEEYYRLNATRDYVACTSKLQSWNQPRKRVLDPLPVNEIKFVKLEYGKVYTRKHETPAYDPRPQQHRHTSDSEIRSLHDQLLSVSTRCAFLHVLPEINQPALAPSTSVSSLPPIPRSVREKVLVEMKSSQHPLSLQQIRALGTTFVQNITPSQPQADAIEAVTRKQFGCKRWHEERFARLTASKFGEIAKCREPIKLCTNYLYNKSSSLTTSALLWGRDHEDIARQQYAQLLADGWSVRACGLYISTRYGYIGASPDGLVFDESNLCGCVEIKCPFSAQDKTVSEACAQTQFYCTLDENNKVTLKQSHSYFYQVQGQLSVLGLPWCDFVIWTNRDMTIQRIRADHQFWDNQVLPKLVAFYSNIMLPELVYPRHPSEIVLLK